MTVYADVLDEAITAIVPRGWKITKVGVDITALTVGGHHYPLGLTVELLHSTGMVAEGTGPTLGAAIAAAVATIYVIVTDWSR